MKISYHGHAIVKIKTDGKEILIDPFITGNPLTDLQVEREAPDVIVLTHGHGDHLGDTVELAKKKNALVIAINELAEYLGRKGLKTHGINIGGSYREIDAGIPQQQHRGGRRYHRLSRHARRRPFDH